MKSKVGQSLQIRAHLYYHNLRVDDHADPVAELRRIYNLVVEHSRQTEREYGPEGLRLFSRIKY